MPSALSFSVLRRLCAAVDAATRVFGRPARHARSERLLHLAPHIATRLPVGTTTLQCVRGCVWVTVAGDAEDHFLAAGERFTAPRGQAVVVHAQHGRPAALRVR